MVKSTDSGITQRTNVYAERTMLQHAKAVIVLDKLGVTKPMPKNKSTTIKFRRPVPFSAATIPLTEGVTPSPTEFSYEDVTVSLKQYGDHHTHTDVIEDTHEDPVLQDMCAQSGENIGRTVEALTYGVVKAGTNVFYGNGTTRVGVNTAISLGKQRAVIRALKAQKGMKITKILSSSEDYDTSAVEAAYVAVCHTDCEADIRGLTGFVPVSKYANRSPLCNEELGSVEDVRYICSPDLEPFQAAGSATLNGMIADDATNVDVYPILFFAKESFGTVPLRGEGAIVPSVISANTITKDDPLGQRGVCGWKTWFAAVRLNELWMARLEVGATDL